MDNAVPCLLGVLGLIGIGMAVWLVAWWILRPLDQAAKRLDRPTQFTIVDFFCLFFLLQWPMAFIHFGEYRQTIEAEGLVWPLDGFVWLACGSLWLASVRALSQAGVTNQWHRAIHLAFVLPVAIVGVIAVPILSVMSVAFVFAAALGEVRPKGWVLAPVIDLALIAGVYAAGQWTRRIVALPPPAPPAEAAGGDQPFEGAHGGPPENRH
jgi:hypothetical protein